MFVKKEKEKKYILYIHKNTIILQHFQLFKFVCKLIIK